MFAWFDLRLLENLKNEEVLLLDNNKQFLIFLKVDGEA
jgi:hypothetical protein